MNETTFWKAKLAAWVHDPAEKALVLLRGESHEAGTTAELCRELFETDRVPEALRAFVKQADHWSAAADRPDLPWKPGERYPEWSKVSFSASPELVHPVSPGVRIDLKTSFKDAGVGELKAVSTDHFRDLVVRNGEGPDFRKTFLRFWRFGPETPAKDLNLLWQLLPADTRSPDHTIWDHLKLCSAFSGIFAAGDEPALMVVSLGPVQGFIAQARSTSDLWAGSHFLSQLCFRAMLPIVETLGPDCILFPDLHGVPAMDQWLVEQRLWPEGKPKPWERKDGSAAPLDRDPRMAAALPNRFVAIVPSKQVEEYAGRIPEDLRRWAREQALAAAARFFEKSGTEEVPETARLQVEEQMRDFPEFYWSAVPWTLVKDTGGKVDPAALFEALERFLPEGTDPAGTAGGAWDTLSRPAKSASGDWRFYEPNRGAAYTHLYGLTERLHGAAKTARDFEQTRQEGYRCTVCGEREWLTEDRALLDRPAGKRDRDPWARLASDGSGPVRKNEYLCAWCTLKRFWPSIFPESVEASGSRFVVSTHTMALAPSIEAAIDRAGAGGLDAKAKDAAARLGTQATGFKRTAFPLRLWRKIDGLKSSDSSLADTLAKLPAFLDSLSDAEEMGEEVRTDAYENMRKLLGARPEAYYALVLMDGDRMGGWVAGTNAEQLPSYRQILHSKTGAAIANEFPDDRGIREFLEARRPNTPARHQAISRALNHFSLSLARIVVEEIFTGKLIYAGGDDLLAMVSVQDLPGLMLALRALYSGLLLDAPGKWESIVGRSSGDPRLTLKKGYALLERSGEKRLFTTMGPAATASVGAVIAHHKAPLGRVLRSLRSAERRVKDAGGRDAFCLRIEKRAGGTSTLVGKWWDEDPAKIALADTTVTTLLDLRDVLAKEGVSRRAAYLLHDQLRDLPADTDALERNIAFRLRRQGVQDAEAKSLGRRLANLAVYHGERFRETANGRGKDDEVRDRTRGKVPKPNRWLQDFFITAEFLARRQKPAKGGDGE